ncbi:MAG TPA: SET domain-containing protein [Candidatus Paceibacterota bacterium]|nr:SET domain-containing protein [Candidatus Paceibacterota bacterium]
MTQKTTAKSKKKSKFEPVGYKLRVGRSRTGLGLFALEDIKRGTCIIEYTGREISKEEQYTSRSKYLFEINRTKTIDGATRSNTARYINHSCAPNCEIEIKNARVFVMAKKNIKAGEELNYDYDTEYFNEYIKPRGCLCQKCSPTKK